MSASLLFSSWPYSSSERFDITVMEAGLCQGCYSYECIFLIYCTNVVNILLNFRKKICPSNPQNITERLRCAFLSLPPAVLRMSLPVKKILPKTPGEKLGLSLVSLSLSGPGSIYVRDIVPNTSAELQHVCIGINSFINYWQSLQS
jgi:hypothetical protein